MSDDQGGGDYGFMGNEIIRTPELDVMAKRSGLLTKFYVSPVCAPTRASLMTGRYNYRTRCIDTYVGRAMMDPAEVTIAELLRAADYRTGIYGKWHLGDNYPMRPMDQGFEDSLIHRGGGISQPSDPIGAEGKYTDPTLIKNGVETPMKGYCTDIYFDGAMDFIEAAAKRKENFFTYIATNAPHGPYHDVPEKLYQEYLKVDFRPIMINKNPSPARLKSETDKLARICAMITNIDENVGRLFRKLDQLGIRENTIVLYLNDNGPNSMRYVGNMRGMKAHIDDGGVRSPLVFHWPAQVKARKTSDILCAHIDLMPTLLDACDVKIPAKLKIDGRSFLPVLEGKEQSHKSFVFGMMTTRGIINGSEAYAIRSVRDKQYKLIRNLNFESKFTNACSKSNYFKSMVNKANLGDKNAKRLVNAYHYRPEVEFYDIQTDPLELNNLAADPAYQLEITRLSQELQRWMSSQGDEGVVTEMKARERQARKRKTK